MSLQILEKKQEQKTFNYPLAFRASSGRVVLFFSINTGVVLKASPGYSDAGYSSRDFYPHTNSSFWTPVDISIVHP